MFVVKQFIYFSSDIIITEIIVIAIYEIKNHFTIPKNLANGLARSKLIFVRKYTLLK